MRGSNVSRRRAHRPESLDPPDFQVDLHGMRPDDALRHLARELHTARVRRERRVLVITGRGWGNLEQRPILRLRVESWLLGEQARRLGVSGFRVGSRGGSLELELALPDEQQSDGHA